MSEEAEDQPVPNWLLKLEEQRERRLKARLGHEAGAGAKCQKCEDKCPGLDLHFWRKICKACKCGKEDHDITDDDIYGYVQFQLLGSKPIKTKGIFLKGRKDEVVLEWTPKGSSNDVKKYLDELPNEMIPVKGSQAAKIRKQMLQKQMPAHDVDASLCHALTADEIKELEEYVAHIRKHSVGQGKIIRLSILKGNQHKLGQSNQQILSQLPPTQIASSQTVFLQSADMANNLHNLTLKDKLNNRPNIIQNNASINPPPKLDENTVLETTGNYKKNYAAQNYHQTIDNQSPKNAGKITDLNYPSNYYNPSSSQNVVHPLTTTNVERHQEQFENANFDHILNPHLNYAPNYLNPVEHHQLPMSVGVPKDLKYPVSLSRADDKVGNNENSQFSNLDKVGNESSFFNPNYANQIGVQGGPTKDGNFPKINNANVEKIPNSLPQFNPNFIGNIIDQNQLPVQIGQLKDLKYPNVDNLPVVNNATHPLLQSKQDSNPNNPTQNTNPNQVPTRLGQIQENPINANFPDQNQLGHHLKQNIIRPGVQNRLPSHSGQDYKYFEQLGDNYPIGLSAQNPINANIGLPNDPKHLLSHFGQNPNIPKSESFQNQDIKSPLNNSDLKQKPKIPVLKAQNAINPLELPQNQNLKSIGYLRDLDYPIEKIPDELNSNQVPKCHSCRDYFDEGSIAISADRSDNLWHSKCFNCHTCKQPLADLLYFYHKDSDNIYCGRDYAILKGIPRCLACDELIFVREYCLAEDNTFHIKHFCCFECDVPLAGKQYVMENNQPVCVDCYEAVKAEKCQDCGYVIGPDQQGVSLQNLHWHANNDCFACKMCRKSLLGGKMLLRNNNLFCSDVCFKSY